MTDDLALEAAVAGFLARRDAEPALTPEAFAAERPDLGSRLLPALRRTLEVLDDLEDEPRPPPRTIGGYEVLREIGRGGMGVVYEVRRQGRRYALKLLRDAALAGSRAVERFLREARALQRVRHEGVVQVHEVGRADGAPFLVLEHIAGRALTGSAAMPWREATEVALRVARALAAVHASGLCHRDLKPDNVLLRGDGAPVLVDFGLVHDEHDVTLTLSGDLVGTPRYLSPEQAAGADVDARSDVFALGLVLAELLTGRPVRAAADWRTLRRRALAGERPRLPPAVPEPVVRIVHTALARSPRRRFADGAAMAAALQRALRGEPVAVRPPGLLARLGDRLALHPRIAGAAGAAGVLAVLAAALLLGESARRARQRAAEREFAAGVTAWLRQDMAAASGAGRRCLDEDATHDGGVLLAALVTDDAPAAQPDRLPPELRAALQLRQQGRWQEAAEEVAAACRDRPECPLRQILRAQLEARAGQPARAAEALAVAEQLLPDRAELLQALGDARLRAGDADGAAAAFRRAAGLCPEDWQNHRGLARALYATDAQQGLSAVRAAKALLGEARSADWLDCHGLEAALLDKVGRPEAAVSILRELVATEPGSSRHAFNLGYALDRQLEVAEARRWYEQALRLDPANERAALCLVWLLATAAAPIGDVPRAEDLLCATLRGDGGRSPAVRTMVREFAIKTGRVQALSRELELLAAAAGLLPDERNSLLHLRSFICNVASGR